LLGSHVRSSTSSPGWQSCAMGLRSARMRFLSVGTWHCCHTQPHTCSTLPVSPSLLPQNCHNFVLHQILAQTLLQALQAAQAQKVHWTSSGAACDKFKGRRHGATTNLNQANLMLITFSIGGLQAALPTAPLDTAPLTCSLPKPLAIRKPAPKSHDFTSLFPCHGKLQMRRHC
jgi:uncharacterized protein YfaA (DUF2138 family)